MKVITIFIIIVFLLATGGIVILYLAQPAPIAPTIEIAPQEEVVPIEETGPIVLSGDLEEPEAQSGIVE